MPKFCKRNKLHSFDKLELKCYKHDNNTLCSK